MTKNNKKPDYLFEVSWEVCNKVGGIHTVVATKSVSLIKEFSDNLILIGPDLIKETGTNPEFEQDDNLFADWVQQAYHQGIHVKAGRWKIQGKPISLLVDFSNYFNRKDEIFSRLWEDFKLDSLSGQWDYIEPTLFGYAVGEMIESFIRFHCNTDQTAVAQFHEWMTGSGLLYLKTHLPQVATAFTTHATALGRSIAGNNKPLYNKLEKYNTEEVAKEFNLVSKQSLERLAAVEADVFTTVSEITARECSHFLSRNVDVVTVNGFEDSIIPAEKERVQKRTTGREKMLKVASALLGEELPKNTYIVSTGGRYEYKNKGIDLLIDALGDIRKNEKLDRPLVAFLLIPAHHYGARKDLKQAIEENRFCESGSKFLTHNLHDIEWDPIMQQIKKLGFTNNKSEKLKVIFVPSYLNGNDGIFDMPYYDLLIGCDQTVYASYYEPWGYTPLESLVFSIPTVTTTLAGFGVWAKDDCNGNCDGITVIDRDDSNDEYVSKEISKSIVRLFNLSRDEIEKVRKKALETSQTALWKNLVDNYYEAYGIALTNAEERSDRFVDIDEMQVTKVYETIMPLSNKPNWKQLVVKSNLPKGLEKIEKLTGNIWWTWDDEAQELFEQVDPFIWRTSNYNPHILFEQVPYKRLETLSKDKEYIKKLDRVYSAFSEYMKGADKLTHPQIAYFSMEFGFHDSLKLYSGGLGVLAGDYLKEASDAKVNIVAIGLLYRYGYFDQILTVNGEQKDTYEYQHFSKLPIHPVKNSDGSYKTIQVTLPGRLMHARIW
ncbi:MAG: DUF3417 domain-containing protein, partial [Bacteroidales bacterium]|nr:DUF3417 domain-containing protein [Bacteroidales bacterium]